MDLGLTVAADDSIRGQGQQCHRATALVIGVSG